MWIAGCRTRTTSRRPCLLESEARHEKRPVIGREPSGPFSTERVRRILAGHSDPATTSASFPRLERVLVGQHLASFPPLTRERGPYSHASTTKQCPSGFWAVPSPFTNSSLRELSGMSPTARQGSTNPFASLRGFDWKNWTVHADRPLTYTKPVGSNHQTARKVTAMSKDGHETLRKYAALASAPRLKPTPSLPPLPIPIGPIAAAPLSTNCWYCGYPIEQGEPACTVPTRRHGMRSIHPECGESRRVS